MFLSARLQWSFTIHSSQKVQKPASEMAWGSNSAHGIGDLYICEGTTDDEAYVGI